MNINELPIKTGIIDYGNPVNGGVPIHINITIYDFSFFATYWIHPNSNFLLECDPRFLKLFGVIETNTLPFYIELCEDIDSILPNKEDIFKELL